MPRYGMVVNLDRCIGCYNCQIACKDEHVGNDFLPIAKAQPTRVVPLSYGADDAEPWTIEARGQQFVRPDKAAVACWVQGSKQYVYSKDRLLTPLKRVDFDPDGERNPQNRGVSGYEPISWDDALSIVSKEIVRIKEKHGASAIAVTGSSHDSWGNIGYRMSALDRFWNLVGCTWIDHNPESWEGFIHQWGCYWRLGQPPAYDLLQDTFAHTETIVFWGADPTTTSGDYAWHGLRAGARHRPCGSLKAFTT